MMAAVRGDGTQRLWLVIAHGHAAGDPVSCPAQQAPEAGTDKLQEGSRPPAR